MVWAIIIINSKTPRASAPELGSGPKSEPQRKKAKAEHQINNGVKEERERKIFRERKEEKEREGVCFLGRERVSVSVCVCV